MPRRPLVFLLSRGSLILGLGEGALPLCSDASVHLLEWRQRRGASVGPAHRQGRGKVAFTEAQWAKGLGSKVAFLLFFFFSVTHEAIILLHCSFALQEPLGKIWRYMWWSRLGDAVGISWVEARDAAKHPKVQGHPTIKSRPALMSAVPWSGNCYISKNHRCSVILRLCSLCLFCFCYCVSKRVFRIVASVLPGQGFYWVGLITPETVAL